MSPETIGVLIALTFFLIGTGAAVLLGLAIALDTEEYTPFLVATLLGVDFISCTALMVSVEESFRGVLLTGVGMIAFWVVLVIALTRRINRSYQQCSEGVDR